MTRSEPRVLVRPAAQRTGALEWMSSTDHKKIGMLIMGTALVLFFAFGALAMMMRMQLARPDQHILTNQQYNQIMTLHGTGMISLVVTPLAFGFGVYLIPLMIGAPTIAAPRATLMGYWLYVVGAIVLIFSCAWPDGADTGWWGYTPLSNSFYAPGYGMTLWIIGVGLAACGMMTLSFTVGWTILTRRAPGVTMMRLPVFGWAMLVTCLMGMTAFPSLLSGMTLLGVERLAPGAVQSNFWNVMYEHLFWFYGHPVVYIMFFPFIGNVAQVVSCFAGRKYFAYKSTALALLVFAAGSMAVWGHHMFTSHQVTNDYYSVTSNFLAIPAGVEYFGLLGTLVGARMRYPTSMLFGLAFIPQFLIGGLTGILIANPAIDYQVNNSYFIVGHFHYTLLAGSVFGVFAGIYFWLPKATGIMYSEKLGKMHFWLMLIGTNVTFLPMFASGYLGMTRRIATYNPNPGLDAANLISTIGAFVIGLSLLVFLYNLYYSARRQIPASPNPWYGQTLEWATSSPPPRFNFNAEYPVPQVRSYAPLLDLRGPPPHARPRGVNGSPAETTGEESS